MSEAAGKANPSPSQSTSSPKTGCRRALIVVIALALVVALLGSLFVFLGLPAIGCPKAGANAPAGSVSEFCFAPFRGSFIGGIVAGPDGNLWFTEGARIGRITPGGSITEFARPTSDNTPGGIVAGPDGNLWFIEQTANALGRITPQGVVTQFPLPPGDSSPVDLAAGPDGALWYTRSPNSGAAGSGPPNTGTPGLIGRMTLSGTATEFTLPAPPAPRPPAQPRDIVAGPDGALWFDTGVPNGVASGNSWIGRITTSGQASIVYTPDLKALVSIADIAVGPDHTLWFTQMSNTINTSGSPGTAPFVGSIGRLTPSGDATLFPLPSSVSSTPAAITAGPDGALWFAAASGKIGRITTSGQVTSFPLPDSSAVVGPMTEGPGSAVWFTQNYPDIDPLNGLIWGTKIGRISV
jgi:streptogramin lyase